MGCCTTETLLYETKESSVALTDLCDHSHHGGDDDGGVDDGGDDDGGDDDGGDDDSGDDDGGDDVDGGVCNSVAHHLLTSLPAWTDG